MSSQGLPSTIPSLLSDSLLGSLRSVIEVFYSPQSHSKRNSTVLFLYCVKSFRDVDYNFETNINIHHRQVTIMVNDVVKKSNKQWRHWKLKHNNFLQNFIEKTKI